MVNRKLELSYFSGYLDGDGCFYIGYERRKKRLKLKPVAVIIISSVNKHTLDSFEKVFGGSVQLAKDAHNNFKALFRYTVRKRNLLTFAHELLPILVEKKEECELMIKFAESTDEDFQLRCKNKIRILKDVGNLVSMHHKEEFMISRNIIEPTEEDFAYLAGFIDAECCFSISKYKPKAKPNFVYKIMLSCNNTKYPVFKWLLERFGGNITFVNRSNTLKANKNQLMWRLGARALFKIISRIHPFLRHKKPVCEELMKFYATTLKNGGARHTSDFRNHYSEVIRIREEIVETVHKLNLKGIQSF